MKRTALAMTLMIELVLLGVIVQRISWVNANPFFKDNYCDISIPSPQNMMYDTGNIILDFTVKTKDFIPPEYDYFYSIDGDIQSSVEVEDIQITSEEEITNESIVPYTETTFKGQAELPFLTDGTHSIKVFSGHFINGKINYITSEPYSATADFIVVSGTASPSPEPTPTPPEGSPYSIPAIVVIGDVIAIAFVCLGLLFYFKKRKH